MGSGVIAAAGPGVWGRVSFNTPPPPGGGGATAATGGPSAAPAAAPAAVPAPAPAGGAPVWPWVLGAVVLVGGGVAAALRLGRG